MQYEQSRRGDEGLSGRAVSFGVSVVKAVRIQPDLTYSLRNSDRVRCWRDSGSSMLPSSSADWARLRNTISLWQTYTHTQTHTQADGKLPNETCSSSPEMSSIRKNWKTKKKKKRKHFAYCYFLIRPAGSAIRASLYTQMTWLRNKHVLHGISFKKKISFFHIYSIKPHGQFLRLFGIRSIFIKCLFFKYTLCFVLWRVKLLKNKDRSRERMSLISLPKEQMSRTKE